MAVCIKGMDFCNWYYLEELVAMDGVIELAGVLVAAYLVGSLPTAVIMSRLVAGVDVRELGTGNAGAANVFREIDPRVGVFVAVVDILKGLLPVLIADRVLDLGPTGVGDCGSRRSMGPSVFSVSEIQRGRGPGVCFWRGCRNDAWADCCGRIRWSSDVACDEEHGVDRRHYNRHCIRHNRGINFHRHSDT